MIEALAQTFQVSPFDVMLGGGILILSGILYYTISLHRLFEAAFGAIIGIGVYILLSVLLIGDPHLGSEGGIFPLGFSVFLVSISVYLVFILAIIFPLHGGLIISEPTHPTLYTILFFFVSVFLFFALGSVIVYMVEQSYVFKVGNIFTWLKDGSFYLNVIKPSAFYSFVMSHQYAIIPLAVVLMLYKLLLANIVTAAVLSVWYNLANVGFYRKKEDSHYRVEFHEVGGSSGGHGGGHDDHGHGGGHADAGHDDHGHGGGHGGGHH
ncbi:MAG: hypothetical protein HHAS10_08640 [Candidatus Altimarinota bacterium]